MLIYWSRLIPRFLILAAVIGLLWLKQDDLIRWQIKNQIESQTGTSARIGSVHSDLSSGNVTINDIELFDPKSPERKLIQIGNVSAKGNFEKISKRYLDFTQIDAEGIKVVIDGVDGQQFVPDKLWLQFKDRIPKEIDLASDFDWSLFLTENPEEAAKQLFRQLDTSRLVDELQKRWPDDVKQIETHVATIEARFQQIKNLFDKETQPTDKLDVVNRLLQELEGTDINIQQLLTAVAQLKNKAGNDYQSLVEATKQDREKLQSIQTPQINVDKLSESLIGPDIKEQWDKTLAWGDWARSLFVPVKVDEKKNNIYEHFGLKPPEKFNGETIHFVALDARPDLLIENMNLTGEINFGGLPIFFNGVVKNIAQSIQLAPEPTVAQFCFSGNGVPVSPIRIDESRPDPTAILDPDAVPEIFVTVSVDRIGQNEEDQLIVHCPAYRLSERILGNPNKFGISVAPGQSRLDGVIIMKEEQLSGQIRIVQSNTKLAVLLPEKLQGSSLHSAIQQTLNALDGFTAEVFVSGTRQQPQYAFKSDIADRLRPQIETLASAEWDNVRQQANTLLTTQANQAVESLNSIIKDKLDPTLNDIGQKRNQWEQQIAGAGLPVGQLVESQLSKLSPKDQERIEKFMQSSAIQSLLQNQQNGNTTATQQRQTEQIIDGAIQEGVEKLQEKLPGLLDRLRNRRQE